MSVVGLCCLVVSAAGTTTNFDRLGYRAILFFMLLLDLDSSFNLFDFKIIFPAVNVYRKAGLVHVVLRFFLLPEFCFSRGMIVVQQMFRISLIRAKFTL